jgi:hypothetical protein
MLSLVHAGVCECCGLCTVPGEIDLVTTLPAALLPKLPTAFSEVASVLTVFLVSPGRKG